MTATLGAFAAGFATALVAFDERATEDGYQRGEFALEGLAALLQECLSSAQQFAIDLADLL
jgi:hypothetical protein